MAIVLCVCFLLSGGKFDPIEQQCVFFSLPPVFVGKAVSSKIEKIQKTKRNCFSKTSKGSCAVVCVSFFFLFRVCKCVCVSACLTHPSSRLPSKGKSIRNQLKTQQMNFFFFSIEKVFWKKIFLEEKRTQPSPPPPAAGSKIGNPNAPFSTWRRCGPTNFFFSFFLYFVEFSFS